MNKVAFWVVIASIPFGILLANLARPAYRAWRQSNALTIARNCLQKNDVSGAFAAFRKAIRIDPRNPAVWRAMADYLEAHPSADAFFVRQRLAQLEPQVAEHHYKLAEIALAINDAERAKSALTDFPESEHANVRFRLLQARVLEAGGDLVTAEKTLQEAVRDNPGNAEAQFRLDRIHLLMPDAGDRTEAARRMDALTAGKDARAMEARRILVQASGAAGDFSTASRNAEVLVDSSDATVADWTKFLDVEFASTSFTLAESIQRACTWGLAHPQSLAVLVDYFTRRGVVPQVRARFEKEAASGQASLPVQQARLGLAIADRDWDHAFDLIPKANPGSPEGISQQTSEVDRAYRANAADALEKWNKEVGVAKGNIGLLNTLLQLSTAWEWRPAQENVLWMMGDASPGIVMVWKILAELLAQDNDAPGLARALSGVVTADPTDFRAKDQWLRLQFLLNLGEKGSLAKVAKDNLDSAGAQAGPRLTYAMLLADMGRSKEALEAVKDISPSQLNKSSRALDYAFILAKASKPTDAQAALASLPPGVALLDEETALVERTKAIIAGKDEKPVVHVTAKDDANARKMLEQLQREQGAENGGASARSLVEQLHHEQGQEGGQTAQSLFESLKRDAASENSKTKTAEDLKRELESEVKPSKP